MTDLEKINAYVESHRDEMLETYRKVILQESYHSAPEKSAPWAGCSRRCSRKSVSAAS